ncbi:DUF86 domain-containing protein [Bacillus sp. HMF5848]|uniref:DUF86 domain-containing protein n=1 Tax=Bacillus sp. HMF5848 TaxID=2495421 RepID=UPI000F78249E|nr:DUF86 domain-containing protein [Bacillus sp. HMF5848]RSK28439.1 DUF86 domain-containing protein [Bacillus sp. HMF5848]
MYFVDRDKIENILQYLEEITSWVEQQTDIKQTNKLAFERAVYVIIDGVLDVGNAMIDGFIMRDPGSYADIIDILEDEKVVPHSVGEQLKQIIELRKMLTQQYFAMDHDVLYKTTHEFLSAAQKFPTYIREYIAKELGPVNAFKK